MIQTNWGLFLLIKYCETGDAQFTMKTCDQVKWGNMVTKGSGLCEDQINNRLCSSPDQIIPIQKCGYCSNISRVSSHPLNMVADGPSANTCRDSAIMIDEVYTYSYKALTHIVCMCVYVRVCRYVCRYMMA